MVGIYPIEMFNPVDYLSQHEMPYVKREESESDLRWFGDQIILYGCGTCYTDNCRF